MFSIGRMTEQFHVHIASPASEELLINLIQFTEKTRNVKGASKRHAGMQNTWYSQTYIKRPLKNR